MIYWPYMAEDDFKNINLTAKDITSHSNLSKNEKLEKQKKENSQTYAKAKERLDKCKKDLETGQPLLDYILLDVYGVDEKHLHELTEIEKDELMRVHVYQDLFSTNMYTPNGDPSQINLDIAEKFGVDQLNMEDYHPLPKNWLTTSNELRERAPIDYSKDRELGNTKIEDGKRKNTEDPVENFVLKFTKQGSEPAAVALPFVINADYRFNIENTTSDFMPPFGGQNCRRIVFIKKVL